MIMFEDSLYQVFEQHLHSTDCAAETQEEFIYRVVECYVMELLQLAHIPIHYLAHLQEDLEEEVRQMLSKKTYGFYSIEEYRKAQG
jgi:hypothetical protein